MPWLLSENGLSTNANDLIVERFTFYLLAKYYCFKIYFKQVKPSSFTEDQPPGLDEKASKSHLGKLQSYLSRLLQHLFGL